MFPFAEWTPDLPALENPGSTVAKNVIPKRVGYGPLRAVSEITDAMNARMRGGIAVKDNSGSVLVYAGSASKLYSVSGTAHTDRTTTGAASGGTGVYALGDFSNWKFSKWGEYCIAVAIEENPQVIGLGGANFADLGGSPPKASSIAVINNFVVLGDVVESGTRYPNKVRWSAIDDHTDWAASATTQSDSQLLLSDEGSGGGAIMAVTGGEYGNVFMEATTWRMAYSGLPSVFEFSEVLPGVGTAAANSVTREGRLTHFLTTEGFCQLTDGYQPKWIGRDKIDDWFNADFDASYPSRVIASSDPESALVYWIYPGQGHVDGAPNRILIYNWHSEKWSYGEIDMQWIFRSLSAGYTLDDLDSVNSSIDAISPSLDSKVWKGGTLEMAVYSNNHKKGTLGGTPLDGCIETAEVTGKGSRVYVNGVRPLVDGTATVQIGTRNKMSEEPTYSTAVTPHASTGIANMRSDARYQRIRVNTSGEFTEAIGVDLETKDSSYR
jgi:hypothetical protein